MVISKGDDLSVGADMSLVFVLVPNMLMSLIPLALLAGMAYGVTKAIQALPPVFFKAQQSMKLINNKLKDLSKKAASPIVKAHGIGAMGEALFGRKNKIR